MARRKLALVECFSEVDDPRMERTKRHLLSDVLALSVLAVIAGAEGWEDIEEFGHSKQSWLKQYLALENGIPSHDTISRVFRALKPNEFNVALTEWMKTLHEQLGFQQVAIDGKTLRRSHDRSSMQSALHLVSAWSVANHWVLGQEATDAKSNEITAIPKLLQLLELKGALVTIDAMGCQKEIARQIVEGGGDYVLAVKDNQPTLHAAISDYFHQLYFILSLPPQVKRFGAAVRGHWGIENSLHWTLDMTFREDESRICKDHGPENFATIRRTALGLIKLDKSKGSVKKKRKRAAWNNAALLTIAQNAI